jgi:hypothetical protein
VGLLLQLLVLFFFQKLDPPFENVLIKLLKLPFFFIPVVSFHLNALLDVWVVVLQD